MAIAERIEYDGSMFELEPLILGGAVILDALYRLAMWMWRG